MAYRGKPPFHNPSPSTSVISILTEDLPCRTTCIRMAISPSKQTYVIVGDENGQVSFFATGREHIARFQCSEVPAPIRAMDAGDFRQQKRDEVVVILADGSLLSLNFPCKVTKDVDPPVLAFCQQINANVCAAKIIDVDGDGKMELVTISSDKAVTVYRFEDSCLAVVHRYEVPAQISGFAFGVLRSGSVYAMFAQAMQDFVVHIKFTSADTLTLPKTLISDPSHFNIPSNPLEVSLMGSIVQTVLLVDDDHNVATELKNFGGNISCITAVKLDCGYHLILTASLCGLLLVYSWLENSVPQLHALCQAQLLTEVAYLSAISDAQGSLLVAVTNIYSNMAIYRINLSVVLGKNLQKRTLKQKL